MHNFSNMANSDLQETGPNKVELVFNILAYSVITRHIQEVSRDITAHSEACVTPVYSEPWYIQNPGIFRTMTYAETWNIQNPDITLVPWEPWYIQNHGMFIIRAIFRTLEYSESQAYWQPCETYAIERFTNIMKILFCTIFWICYSETGRSKIELVLNILAYSNIIRHIQELSRDIQTHSEACITLVYSEPLHIQNPDIFRTLVYSESGPYPEHWYIQDLNE